MPIKAVLFDLDGTLLPLEFSDFIPGYFRLLILRFGATFPNKSLPEMLEASTNAVTNNDGSKPNADVFWTDFESRSGKKRVDLFPAFEQFYQDDFGSLGLGVGIWEEASVTVESARSAGLATVLATNPIFPRSAILHRLQWAGLNAAQFNLITDYENMCFAKPKPGYYRQVAEMLEIDPAECLMIGNDVILDLEPARAAGMLTFMVRNDYSVDGVDGFVADYEGSLEDITKVF